MRDLIFWYFMKAFTIETDGMERKERQLLMKLNSTTKSDKMNEKIILICLKVKEQNDLLFCYYMKIIKFHSQTNHHIIHDISLTSITEFSYEGGKKRLRLNGRE